MNKLTFLILIIASLLALFNSFGKSKVLYQFNCNADSLKYGFENNLPEVEVMPCFPAGNDSLLRFLAANLKYPGSAKIAQIEGKVVISFVVEKNGSLSNFEIVKNISKELDEEALRVAKLMDKWIPGKLKGKIVRTRMAVPFLFKLQ